MCVFKISDVQSLLISKRVFSMFLAYDAKSYKVTKITMYKILFYISLYHTKSYNSKESRNDYT